MTAWTTFLLVLHILGAVIAFGPVFAFPFLGIAAEREPMYANVLLRVNEKIGTGLVIPLGLFQGVTGLLLLFAFGIDLTHNAWLGLAIIIYAIAILAAIFHQSPKTKLLIDMTAQPNPPVAEIQALVARVKFVGQLLTLAIVVIVILMVTRPGGTL